MKKVDEKNIHSGHRKRLGDLMMKAGVDCMSDIQVMEYFLTYIFPRGDVNPLAHRLLQEFEDFNHVIEADIQDLMRVSGINERSAQKIKMFSELFYYYTSSKMGKKCVVKCRGDIIDVLEDHLRFRTTENMVLLALSPGNIITHKRRITINEKDRVSISVLEFTQFLSSAKPTSLAVGHCHPYGKSAPSSADKKAFEIMNDICTTCGVNFLDSYIIGEDGVYSQRDEILARTYCDIDTLKNVFKVVK